MGYQKRRHDVGKGNLVRFGRRKWVVVIMFHYTCIHSLSRIKKSVTKTWAHKITSFTMAQPHTAGAHWSPSPLFYPSPLSSCSVLPHSWYRTHVLLFFLPHCQCSLTTAVSPPSTSKIYNPICAHKSRVSSYKGHNSGLCESGALCLNLVVSRFFHVPIVAMVSFSSSGGTPRLSPWGSCIK